MKLGKPYPKAGRQVYSNYIKEKVKFLCAWLG